MTPLPRMLLRGLVGRCPRCGAGRLFTGWFRMRDRCPGCGYRFEREEGFFLGAYVVNLGITMVALLAFIGGSLALTLPDPPTAALLVAGATVAILVPLAFYPVSRTLWAAFDLAMQPLTAEEAERAATAVAVAEARGGPG